MHYTFEFFQRMWFETDEEVESKRGQRATASSLMQQTGPSM